jgi:peptidoglycan/LPS O-acetylase OafA/YrhL
VVKSRILGLAIPYVVWTVTQYIISYLNGTEFSLLQVATGLLIGRHYFFIPLLFQLYLLSPILVPLAKRKARLLIGLAAITQLAYTSVPYIKLYGTHANVDIAWADLLLGTSGSFLLRWWLFFVVGLAAGFRLNSLRDWTYKYRWYLLAATIVFAAASVVESLIVFRTTELEWWVSSVLSLPTILYVFSFTLSFVALAEFPRLVSSYLRQLGQITFGVYLVHRIILEYVARGVQRFLPWFLPYQAAFFLVLVATAIELPRLVIWAMDKSPARRLRPYIFG